MTLDDGRSVSSPYAAIVEIDPALGTTVVSLSYTDPREPARNLLVCVAPELGSNLYRIKAGKHELIHCDYEHLKKREHTGIFVLWPFPNRVRERKYTYRDQSYSLANVPRPQSGPLIHGLVYDRSWSYEQPSADQQTATVTTFVEINPGTPYYEAYPFASRLSLTYTLTSAGVTITYRVQNQGDKPLPHGFGLHPYFNLLAGKEHTLVTLPATSVMEADTAMLPTGRTLDIRTMMYAMFDLNQPRPISHLKLDHVYTGLPAASSNLIDYSDLGLRLRVAGSPDLTHMVIYTPQQQPYFCLENQTCATDAINLHQRGMRDVAHLLELAPGAEQTGSIYYAVEWLNQPEAHIV